TRSRAAARDGRRPPHVPPGGRRPPHLAATAVRDRRRARLHRRCAGVIPPVREGARAETPAHFTRTVPHRSVFERPRGGDEIELGLSPRSPESLKRRSAGPLARSRTGA